MTKMLGYITYYRNLKYVTKTEQSFPTETILEDKKNVQQMQEK